MVVGVGNDILEISRMRREVAHGAGGFRDQVFTPAEIAYCESQRYPERHYAARFAAKEALFKALQVGAAQGSAWREVEVTNGRRGEPALVLHGGVKRLAGRRGVRRMFVSLSHTPRVATASVILEA
jgi:holo-[acyl-carrier protein] synthase